MDRLGHAVERVKRHEGSLFAVLFVDLDRFKVVNDSLGHASGDQLLIAVAQRLERCLRAGDTMARLGGDEFTILLEDIKDISDAIGIAERIQAELTLPFSLSGHEVFITASIGIVLSTTGYERLEDILRDADTAMYRAKAQGKACHQVFDRAMHIRAVTLLQLENDLRRAVMSLYHHKDECTRDRVFSDQKGTLCTIAAEEITQEFQVHYQPIVSLATGRINGFEALVRWQHPARGLLSPIEFIPIAEETGLIVPLGYWILRSACRQMRVWQERFPTSFPLTISVNLSSKQFLQPDLIQQIDQILRETGLAACSLKLEITESAIMENAETAAVMLLQLRTLGIELYIDDFGTGYSSLSYLQSFPVNALKIDRSFISQMGTDGENSEIVQAIVTLAHKLGIDVVAEGVETAEQLVQLRVLCCTQGQGQGYFFSKPLDSKATEALLTKTPQW
jgi:diguanylate cyclase (GGDEF)-like protein